MTDMEKILVQRSKNGDAEAFEQLVERYQKKVYNIALRMMGNYDDANELSQEALIRVYKSIRNFKEESLFSTWIYRVITNVCLDELRKRKNKKVISLDEEIKYDDNETKRQIEDDKPTPEAAAEINEIRKAVKNAIQKLPDDYRVVIVMRDIHGFSYEEIAAVAKCPVGTVKSRLNRARYALREVLKSQKELFNENLVK